MPLERPKVLVKAARLGARIYRGAADLRRVAPKLASGGASGPSLIAALRAAEAMEEASRKAAEPTYSAARHVGLLAALIAERRRARAAS